MYMFCNATHSSTLAWKIQWIEEPGGPQSIGSQRATKTFALFFFFFFHNDWEVVTTREDSRG